MTHSFTRFPLLLLLCWQLHYDYWILHWRKFVIRLLHVCESVCVCVYVCGGAATSTAELNFHNCLAVVVIVFVSACFCLALPSSKSKLTLSAFKSESWRAFKPLRSCLCPSFSLNVECYGRVVVIIVVVLLCTVRLTDWLAKQEV